MLDKLSRASSFVPEKDTPQTTRVSRTRQETRGDWYNTQGFRTAKKCLTWFQDEPVHCSL
jgi:hypothetical protein